MNPENGPRHQKQQFPPMRQWLVIAIIILAFTIPPIILNYDQSAVEEVTLPDIVSALEAGEVETLTVRGDLLVANKTDGTSLSARKKSNISTVEALQLLGASPEVLKTSQIVVKNANNSAGNTFGILLAFAPLILLGYLFFSLILV